MGTVRRTTHRQQRPAELRDTILYDGDCAFCNGWVKWIVKRDARKMFRFLPIASVEGNMLRDRHHVPERVDSVVLLDADGAHTRSGAAWRILHELPGWVFASYLLRIIPRPLRDLGYRLVARNRHRLGMKDDCDVPQ